MLTNTTKDYGRYFAEPTVIWSADDGCFNCEDGCCAFCNRTEECRAYGFGNPYCEGDEWQAEYDYNEYLEEAEAEAEIQNAVELATAKFEDFLAGLGFWEVEDGDFESRGQEDMYLRDIWQQACWRLNTWINTNYPNADDYFLDVVYNEPQTRFYI